MYNRYHGNSGRFERVEEPAAPRTGAPPPPPPARPDGGIRELGRLLGRLSPARLETEDLLLIAVFWLLFRESRDAEFLFLIAGILLL